MYLVTFEESDGTWFEDPDGFDTKEEARKYASMQRPSLSPTQCIAIYECRLITDMAPISEG